MYGDPSHKNLQVNVYVYVYRSTFAAAVRAFGGPRWPLTGGAPIGGRVRSLREGVTPVSAPRDRPDRGFASGARTSRPPPSRAPREFFGKSAARFWWENPHARASSRRRLLASSVRVRGISSPRRHRRIAAERPARGAFRDSCRGARATLDARVASADFHRPSRDSRSRRRPSDVRAPRPRPPWRLRPPPIPRADPTPPPPRRRCLPQPPRPPRRRRARAQPPRATPHRQRPLPTPRTFSPGTEPAPNAGPRAAPAHSHGGGGGLPGVPVPGTPCARVFTARRGTAGTPAPALRPKGDGRARDGAHRAAESTPPSVPPGPAPVLDRARGAHASASSASRVSARAVCSSEDEDGLVLEGTRPTPARAPQSAGASTRPRSQTARRPRRRRRRARARVRQ